MDESAYYSTRTFYIWRGLTIEPMYTHYITFALEAYSADFFSKMIFDVSKQNLPNFFQSHLLELLPFFNLIANKYANSDLEENILWTWKFNKKRSLCKQVKART